MTVTAVKKVNQYLEVTDDGKVRRYSVDWSDCVVSAIISGRYKVINIYRSGSSFYAVYEDDIGVQYTTELSSGDSDISVMNLSEPADYKVFSTSGQLLTSSGISLTDVEDEAITWALIFGG